MLTYHLDEQGNPIIHTRPFEDGDYPIILLHADGTEKKGDFIIKKKDKIYEVVSINEDRVLLRLEIPKNIEEKYNSEMNQPLVITLEDDQKSIESKIIAKPILRRPILKRSYDETICPWYKSGMSIDDALGKIFDILASKDEEDEEILLKIPSSSNFYKTKRKHNTVITMESSRRIQILEHKRLIKRLKDRLFLIKGFVQSCKTTMIRDTMIWGLNNGLSSILVVRMNGEANQFRERLQQFVEDMKRSANGLDIEIHDLVVKEAKKSLDPQSYASILNGDHPKIIICLGNDHQLQVMNNAFEAALGSQKENETLRGYMLFIDECDYHSASKGLKTHAKKVLALQITRKYAYAIFLVSATVLDTLCEEEISPNHIFRLCPPRGYIGVLQLIPKITSEWSTEEKGDLLVYDIDLYKIFDEFHRKPCHSDWHMKGKHPNIILITISRLINSMKQLMWDIRHKFPTVAVIIYNGDGITISSCHLDSIERLHIKHEIADEISKSINNNREQRCHTFKQLTPGSILLWMKRNGDWKRWPHIIFISGQCAGRCTSFACIDSEGPDRGSWPYWHLTEQRLRLGKKTACPNILQYLRLCSALSSTIPRLLWISESDKMLVEKSFGSQEDLLTLALNKNVNINKALLQNLALYREKIPKGRSLTARVSFNCKRTANENDGGMSYIEGYCFDNERKQRILEDQKRKNDILERKYEEGKEGEIYRIDRSGLSSENANYFDRMIKAFADEKNGIGFGKWVQKKGILIRKIEPDIGLQDTINNSSWHWTTDKSKVRKICKDDSHPGLLFKLVKKTWYVRFNS